MNKTYLSLVSLVALTACQAPVPVVEVAPRTGIQPLVPVHKDTGIVIAESQLHSGVIAKDVDQVLSDCKEGKGFGIEVDTTSGKELRIYDRHGKPCPKADVLFDGTSEKDKRPADLGLKIDFHDPYNIEIVKEANERAKFNDGISYSGGGGIVLGDPLTDLDKDDLSIADQMPMDIAAQAEQMRKAGVPEDQIKQTWQEYEDYSKSLKEKELALAKARQLSRRRTAQLLEQQDSVIVDLGRQLRNAQDKNGNMLNRNETLIEDLASVEAEKYQREKQAQQFYEDSQRLKMLLKENEFKSLKLEESRKALEEEYAGKITKLETELEQSRAEAKIAREAAALQAARQIAEAERLAYASKIAQRQAMEKEAERLKRKADEIVKRASDLPQTMPQEDTEKKVTNVYAELLSGMEGDKEQVYRLQRLLAGGAGDPKVLKAATVVAHVENTKLHDILENLLKDIAPKVGEWKISWQLSDSFAFVPDEKWTVAVESSFGEFLDFVVNRVQQTHGAHLRVDLFDQNRLIVIRDN